MDDSEHIAMDRCKVSIAKPEGLIEKQEVDAEQENENPMNH